MLVTPVMIASARKPADQRIFNGGRADVAAHEGPKLFSHNGHSGG